MMHILAEILVSFFLVVAGIFGLVGSYGLIKLPDTMRRLHAPTKSSTVGVGSVLLASMSYFYLKHDTISLHELLITLFLFLTAPITANFISKAYMLNNVEAEELPKPKGDSGWAGYDKGRE
jgi:multicomponent K+:H+ antiporter subunit G